MQTITLSELITDALELSGRAGTVSDAKVIRAVNKAIRWVWHALAKGYDGFATLETEIQSPASGERLPLAAGSGGANRPDGTPTAPIVRGVHRVRGLYRPTSPGGTDRYPVTWMSREAYYDQAAPHLDDDICARPGYAWQDLSDDGAIDDLVVRPQFQGSELLRLVYTPSAPVLAQATDAMVSLDNAEDAIVHMAGYYLLRAQDLQRAMGMRESAVVIVGESVLEYKGVRPSMGPRSIEQIRRRSRGTVRP